jgi:tetratricopeptide (TPR) repeat protein
MGGIVSTSAAARAAFFATALWAAPTLVSAQASTDQLAVQAKYWEDKGRYDLAKEAWLKLLRVTPNSPTALSGLALAEAKSNRAAAAQVYLDRLRETQPNSPDIRKIEDAIRSGSYDQSKLDAPRTLARQGKFDDAVSGYKQSFGNQIPDGRLGLEYYQTLAGAKDGWEPARQGIARLAAANPGEPIYQLALAQHLTYREETRREGIAKLAELSRGESGVAVPAQQAWRQALIWLGAKPGEEKLYQAYLADHQDAQVSAKLETLRSNRATASAPSAASGFVGSSQGGYPGRVEPREPTAEELRGQAIKQAYDKLNEGELSEATTLFEGLVAQYPDSDDAMGGLGIVRLRQERYGEARSYLQQASQMAPKRASRWTEALSSARFWEQVRGAGAAREAGNTDQAIAMLRSAIAGDPQIAAKNPSVKATLADILNEGGDVEQAEQLYREILAQTPNDVSATRGLVGVLVKRGRIGEALNLAERLPQEQKDELGNLGSLKGQYLRDQAKLASDAHDDAQAEQLLKQALLEDPESPWTRLDLSRIYQRQKRTREANTLIDGLLTGGKAMPEALQIKALLLAEQDNWLEGLQTLEQIPYDKRTQAMADLQRRMWVRYQTSRASVLARYGRPQDAAAILAQVEPYAQDSPELLGSMATALADVGQDGRALNYIRQALSRQSAPDVGLRLQYAGLLFKLRQDAEFEVVMEELVKYRDLTEQQSMDLANLRVAYRLRQADLVREEGNLARAYEYLDPLLKVNPNDPRLIMALARLYTDAKEHQRAAELYRRALEIDPNNLDAYKGAVGAALSLNKIDEAQAMLDQAISLDPQNPRLYALAARAARARGEDGRALQLYQQALKLDQERGGDSEFGGDNRYTPQLYLLDPTTSPVNAPSYGGGYSKADPVVAPAAVAPIEVASLAPAPQPKAVVVAQRDRPAPASRLRAPANAGQLVAVAGVPAHARPPPAAVAALKKLGKPRRQQGDYALVAMPRWWNQGRLIKVSTESDARQVVQRSRYGDVVQVPSAPPAGNPAWVQTAPDRYSYTLQSPSGGAVSVPYGPVQGAQSIQQVQQYQQLPQYSQQQTPSSVPSYVPRQLAPSTQLTVPSRARPRESFRDEMLRNMDEINGVEQAPQYVAPQQAPVQSVPEYPRYSQTPATGPRYPGAAAREQQAQQVQQFQTYPVQQTPVQIYSTPAPGAVYSAAPGVGATEQEYRRQGLRVLPGQQRDAVTGPPTPVYVAPAPQPNYVQVQPAPVQQQPLQIAPAPSPIYPSAQPIYGVTQPPPGPVDLRSDPVLSTPDFVLERRRMAANPPNEVLREIADINAKRTAWASFGLGVRSRDGQSGLDRLTDIETPVEFSVAGVNAGRFRLRAVPVFLDAGSLSGQQVPLFGQAALAAEIPDGYSRAQDESGVAIGAVYSIADFTADIGSSPLGFPVETLVGGLNWRPSLGAVSFKLDLSRRSVTDSLLSYAGAVDPLTGDIWGGVTKTGGRLDMACDLGQYGVYANGSYHVLDGENVARNSVYEIGGGFYARALDTRDMRVTWGLNVTTFFYDKNLRRFTWGHGGYFSPQSYFAVAIPVEWSGGRGRFSYKLNAALGIQSFKEDGTAAFPNDSALQAALEQRIIDAIDESEDGTTTLVAGYSGQNSTGIGFNFGGAFEYLIAPNLAAGARFGLDNARDYEEAQALGYIRFYFSGQRAAARPPNSLLPYYDFGDPTL